MRQCECSLFRMYAELTFSKTVLHFFSRSVEQTFSLTMHIFRHVISSPDIDQPHSSPNLGTPCTQIVTPFLTADSTKIAFFDSIDFEFWKVFAPELQPCHQWMLSFGQPSIYYYYLKRHIHIMDMDKESILPCT